MEHFQICIMDATKMYFCLGNVHYQICDKNGCRFNLVMTTWYVNFVTVSTYAFDSMHYRKYSFYMFLSTNIPDSGSKLWGYVFDTNGNQPSLWQDLSTPLLTLNIGLGYYTLSMFIKFLSHFFINVQWQIFKFEDSASFLPWLILGSHTYNCHHIHAWRQEIRQPNACIAKETIQPTTEDVITTEN
jgi:hypothetical protein